jgi:hypothetical protein
VQSDDESNRLTVRRIIERLPLYFALALAGIAGVVLLVAIQIYFGLPEITDGWWGFAGFTGALFWIVVRESRPLWNRSRFWLTVAVFLAVHCAAFVAVLRAYPAWRPIWFAPITIFEAAVADCAFVLLFREKRPRKHHDASLNS